MKMVLSGAWVCAVTAIAIAVDASWAGRMAMVGLGSLPPLALLLLWNDPAPTMSESINQARR
jgi:hypothetical protein